MTLAEIPYDPNSDDWHEQRRTYIGASEAPAVLGISPYSTPLDVWARKLGIVDDFKGNTATSVGTALEDTVAQEWRKAHGHQPVSAPRKTVRHPDYPHIAASVDYEVLHPEERYDGNVVGLARAKGELIECKFVSDNVAWAWRNGPPVYVQCQAQVQMAVTGAGLCHVAAIIVDRGVRFESWPIKRDDVQIAEIVGRLDTFWRDHVETGVRPELDGDPDRIRETLNKLHATPKPEANPVRLGGWATDLIAEIKRTKALRKDLDEQIKRAENELCDALGDGTDGFVDDNAKPVVTWRPQTRTTYETKRILDGDVDGFTAPEVETAQRVLRAVAKESTTRVLRVAS